MLSKNIAMSVKKIVKLITKLFFLNHYEETCRRIKTLGKFVKILQRFSHEKHCEVLNYFLQIFTI